MFLCLFCVKCHASVVYVPWLIHMCAMTQLHMCHDSVAFVVAYHERQGSRLQGLGPWCSVCVCVVQGVVCVLGGGEASDLHREGFDSAHIEMRHVTQMNESRASRRTHEWVMSWIWILWLAFRRLWFCSRRNESRHTHERVTWVTSHTWISHVTHMKPLICIAKASIPLT